jgi:aspartate dehydrogenase
MKKTFAIAGCGFLGSIVADAYAKGLMPDYELIAAYSRSMTDTARVSALTDCAAVSDIDTIIALKPDYLVETASVEWVRENAVKVLEAGINLVLISIGAFADAALYEQAKAAAIRGNAKIHIASGAIGGFDVLQTVTLMSQALKLAETASIETHTGCRGFMPTPLWEDELMTTQKTVLSTSAKEAFEILPHRVNVAVATSLATTGPDITQVILHSVPNWQGDDHKITAEIDGVKAVVDIYSRTSAIAGWSVVALLRNLASPVCFF